MKWKNFPSRTRRRNKLWEAQTSQREREPSKTISTGSKNPTDERRVISWVFRFIGKSFRDLMLGVEGGQLNCNQRRERIATRPQEFVIQKESFSAGGKFSSAEKDSF
jgi:hypothetical protein